MRDEGRPLKVCNITTSYPRFKGDFPGIFNYRIDRELVREGLSIVVIAPSDARAPAKEDMEGVQVRRFTYFLPRRLQCLSYGSGIATNILTNPLGIIQIPFFFLSLAVNLIRYGRDADVIHCHWIPTGLTAILCKPFLSGKTVITVGGTDIRKLPESLSRFVLGRMDEIICPNLEIKKHLQRLGCDNYTELQTPIDETEFNPSISGSQIEDEFNLHGLKVVVFTGRLYDFKDPLTFVRAIPHVIEHRRDVRFIVVGDGVLLEKLREDTQRMGVSDFVHFPGARGDVNRFLAASDIYTGLSPVENVGANAIAEAMFSGVPLILTDAGYTKEFFSHMKDCIIIPKEDPKALADAICYLLDNPQVSERLVDGAYELLEKSGKQRDKIIADILRLYKR